MDGNMNDTDQPMKGISRIDSGATHSWYVRVYLKGGVVQSRTFSDGAHGGRAEALEKAVACRDAMIADIPVDQRRLYPFRDRPQRNNTTGVHGVSRGMRVRDTGGYSCYFMACYKDIDSGKYRNKSFRYYPEDPEQTARALASAAAFRGMMVEAYIAAHPHKELCGQA